MALVNCLFVVPQIYILSIPGPSSTQGLFSKRCLPAWPFTRTFFINLGIYVILFLELVILLVTLEFACSYDSGDKITFTAV